MTPEETLAVVILNWNGKQFLERFLQNVVENSRPYRVIVADNASTDGSVEFVRAAFPDVEIILNTENGGFAKGYNDALRHLAVKYFVLLNSDVEVSPNWLEPMLAEMHNEKVAGVQPKVLSWKNRTSFEHAGASGGFVDKYYFPFCRGRIFDQVEEDLGQYNYPADIFWATGAAMLIRSDLFWKAGGFDERFFAHMEEIDLCWRINRMGYHFRVAPDSVVYHVGGGTLSYMSPKKTYLNFRNSLLMIQKNHYGGLFWLMFCRLTQDGWAAGMFLLKGQFAHFWAVLKAHVSFYWQLPASMKERRKFRELGKTITCGQYNDSLVFARYFKRVKVFSGLNQRLIGNAASAKR